MDYLPVVSAEGLRSVCRRVFVLSLCVHRNLTVSFGVVSQLHSLLESTSRTVPEARAQQFGTPCPVKYIFN